MRGEDDQQLDVFSYVSPEQRVFDPDHLLRSLRVMTEEALQFIDLPNGLKYLRQLVASSVT